MTNSTAYLKKKANLTFLAIYSVWFWYIKTMKKYSCTSKLLFINEKSPLDYDFDIKFYYNNVHWRKNEIVVQKLGPI